MAADAFFGLLVGCGIYEHSRGGFVDAVFYVFGLGAYVSSLVVGVFVGEGGGAVA